MAGAAAAGWAGGGAIRARPPAPTVGERAKRRRGRARAGGRGRAGALLSRRLKTRHSCWRAVCAAVMYVCVCAGRRPPGWGDGAPGRENGKWGKMGGRSGSKHAPLAASTSLASRPLLFTPGRQSGRANWCMLRELAFLLAFLSEATTPAPTPTPPATAAALPSASAPATPATPATPTTATPPTTPQVACPAVPGPRRGRPPRGRGGRGGPTTILARCPGARLPPLAPVGRLLPPAGRKPVERPGARYLVQVPQAGHDRVGREAGLWGVCVRACVCVCVCVRVRV